MKTRYMVFRKDGKRITDSDCENMEIQKVFDTKEDAVKYAKDYAKYGKQYVAKFVVMEVY